MTFKESKTHIWHRWSSRFLEKTGNSKPNLDPIHCLSRAAQSTIFRLRTGHSRLRFHLKRIGVAETAFRECNTGEQTPGHILQTCPHHQELGQKVWPIHTSMETKLWGTAADLTYFPVHRINRTETLTQSSNAEEEVGVISI